MREQSLCEKEIGLDIDARGNRILLKAVVLPKTTKNGILLPETMTNMKRRSYNVGRVLKMGESCYDYVIEKGIKPYCSVGDWIYYSSYEREDVLIGDFLCYWLNDDRVYGTIKESDLSKLIPELEWDK